MTEVLVIATLLGLVATILVILRVRREYAGDAVLSGITVTLVWLLYLWIVAAALFSAVLGVWPLGLPVAVALPVGALLIVTGLALVAGGLATMASFRRMSGVQPDHLIVAGAYRVSRNPQNVGLGAFLVGAAIAGSSGLALLGAAGFWIAFSAYVGAEERYLTRVFGTAYETYRSRTSRLIGRVKGTPTS